jgi:hypothetical protein
MISLQSSHSLFLRTSAHPGGAAPTRRAPLQRHNYIDEMVLLREQNKELVLVLHDQLVNTSDETEHLLAARVRAVDGTPAGKVFSATTDAAWRNLAAGCSPAVMVPMGVALLSTSTRPASTKSRVAIAACELRCFVGSASRT